MSSDRTTSSMGKRESSTWIEELRKLPQELLSLLQPRPHELREGLPQMLRAKSSSSHADDADEFQIERRAACLNALFRGTYDERQLKSGALLNAYFYCGQTRNTLHKCGYLAGSFVLWHKGSVVIPSVDIELGQQIVRLPWLMGRNWGDSMLGLRRAFRSLLCPAGVSLDFRHDHDTLEDTTGSHSLLDSFFPTLTSSQLETCIREELRLYQSFFTSDTAQDEFSRAFFEWLYCDSQPKGWKSIDDYFDDRFGSLFKIEIQNWEPVRKDGIRLFWFVSYGIFLNGLKACTALYYRNQEGLTNPYLKAFREGRSYEKNVDMFYIPYRRVLASFIDACSRIRRIVIKEHQESLDRFDQSTTNLLRRVGVVVKQQGKDILSPALSLRPPLPTEFYSSSEARLAEFAGQPFSFEHVSMALSESCVSGAERKQDIQTAMNSYGFSPHNLMHYLATDTIPNKGAPGRQVRRGVLWYPLWSMATPGPAGEEDLEVFVANIDEQAVADLCQAEEADSTCLFNYIKAVFSPVGGYCLDLYQARELAELRVRETERMLATHLFASNIHNFNRAGGLTDLRINLRGLLERSETPPQLKETLEYCLNRTENLAKMINMIVGSFSTAQKAKWFSLTQVADFIEQFTQYQRYHSSPLDNGIFSCPSCELVFKCNEMSHLCIPSPIVGTLVHLTQHAIEEHRRFMKGTSCEDPIFIYGHKVDTPVGRLVFTVRNRALNPHQLVGRRRFIEETLDFVWQNLHSVLREEYSKPSYKGTSETEKVFQVSISVPFMEQEVWNVSD